MRVFTTLLILLISFFYVPSFAQTSLTVTSGTPILDGVVSPGEWTSTPLVTAAGVTLNAMADGNYLYLSASWADVTENISKKQWGFDGSSWSQSGDDEDRIAFVWDMDLNGAQGANCATMCHPPLMRTDNGNVDVWHWKSARGNAIGVVDDKYWDTSDRQSDPGTSAYSSNSSMGSGFPSFMATGAPGVNTDFLVNNQNALNAFDPFGTVLPAHTVALAVPFDSTASFTSGDFMAAYLHRVPSGDRASVQTAGKYDSGVWTVEFKKPYAGTDFDFQVVPGSSVEFTHEIFDNEGGSAAGHGAFDPTVYTLDLSQIPAQTSLTVTSGTPTLDGVVSPGEWTSTPLVTAAGVTLNAMADGNYLYLSASWADVTENISKKQWGFDGSSWSQSGDDEDRIAFVWDMDLNGAQGANCATMCHPPLMRTDNGNVDVWHWKSARGNAIGVVDDKYWDTSDRQSDPGTSAYSSNSSMGSGFPSFMATGAPGVNTDFLVNNQNALNAFDPFGTVLPAHTVALAVPFDSTASFTSGDFMAAYLHRVPSGDRASVQTAGKYDSGVWTVEFKKPYAGTDFDFQVVPGSSVEFTHEIFDNEGGSAAGHGAFDPTVYTLDLSQVFVSIDELVLGNIIEDYYLEQNYPNPFNPTTTIEFNIPYKSPVSLFVFNVRGQIVTKLIDKEMPSGNYQILFNAENLASGIYFYNLSTKDFSQIRKMILMK